MLSWTSTYSLWTLIIFKSLETGLCKPVLKRSWKTFSLASSLSYLILLPQLLSVMVGANDCHSSLRDPGMLTCIKGLFSLLSRMGGGWPWDPRYILLQAVAPNPSTGQISSWVSLIDMSQNHDELRITTVLKCWKQCILSCHGENGCKNQV